LKIAASKIYLILHGVKAEQRPMIRRAV